MTSIRKLQNLKKSKPKSINAELESFNNIVSTIYRSQQNQMFISRIEGSEIDTVSEKTRTYFSKLQAVS
jgi:hypothetical protein